MPVKIRYPNNATVHDRPLFKLDELLISLKTVSKDYVICLPLAGIMKNNDLTLGNLAVLSMSNIISLLEQSGHGSCCEYGNKEKKRHCPDEQ